ncbi:DUF4920 domain-containing protein [Robertkochia marina]|uniref:DUF4920 domain-containing protein n=1 Tax=Robertkochia marina TaxID=1227945 RepID=A0A4S3LZ62_9FLAO|nr:DUF4920 domain-containing protein [Robertkochia marina]THD67354.1 DUF4920 domain-containing protein [Robertkochia marina]TRZ43010.1 DUF4920 domain-containing protein [Robertkochia marina]
MKHLWIVLAGVLTATGCKPDGKTDKAVAEETTSEVEVVTNALEFGAGVKAEMVLSAADMAEAYKSMGVDDTLSTGFEAEVLEVCQVKGCWMKLSLGDDRTAMVKFKDYAFFMPKDLAGKKVIVEGKAFVDLMSVEDQKHFAEDAGSSQEEIEAITDPKKTLSFEASGVRIME